MPFDHYLYLNKKSVFLFLVVWTTLILILIFDESKKKSIGVTSEKLASISQASKKVLGFSDLIKSYQQLNTEGETEDNSYFSKVTADEIVYVIVVCEVSKEEVNNSKDAKTGASKSFQRQLIQLDVLLKTAAIFAKRQIHFVVVANTLNAFLKVRDIPSQWPTNLQKNLKFSMRDVWHPRGEEKLLKVFRPCTVECIFLHETLPDIDAAIYIDTDTFFLRSPEDIWPYFQLFNDSQIVGISPCYYWYGTKAFGHPFLYYGDTGINAGVMVMNLTRMRALPFDLSSVLVNMYKKRSGSMTLMDQDILNHFYGTLPQLLYPINCTWNMRFGVCEIKPFRCESAKDGISLIHGPDISFFSETRDESMKQMFHALSSFDVNNNDIRTIPYLLKKALDSASGHPFTKCGKVEGFTRMVLKYPEEILSQKQFT